MKWHTIALMLEMVLGIGGLFLGFLIAVFWLKNRFVGSNTNPALSQLKTEKDRLFNESQYLKTEKDRLLSENNNHIQKIQDYQEKEKQWIKETAQKTELEKRLQDQTQIFDKQFNEKTDDHKKQLDHQQQAFNRQIESDKEHHDLALKKQQDRYETEINNQQQAFNRERDNQNKNHENTLKAKEKYYEDQLAEKQKHYDDKLTEQKNHYESQIASDKDNFDEKLKAKEKALEDQEQSFQKQLDEKTSYYEEKLNDQKQTFEQQRESDKKLYDKKEQHFKELAEKTKIEFENTAKKIFAENTKSYREESSKNLNQLLDPFKKNIEGFKKSVQVFETKGETLDKTLEEFKKTNIEMRDESKELTQALKGDSKTLGEWGEFMLANILEKSGLREGEEFTIQGQGLDAKNAEGYLVRPDVIVKLPDNKCIIVDSKVSSHAPYREYLLSKTETEKSKHLEKIRNSVRKHIDNLSSKKYQDSSGLKSPDFILMFMPHEGIFSLITQTKGLFERAWEKSIVIVSPTTLIATLRTVASIWKIERQNKNADNIAEQGKKLYDKLSSFVEYMEGIKKGLKNAQDSYDKAENNLWRGRGDLIGKAKKLKDLNTNTPSLTDGGIISSAEKMRELGVKPNKKLPASYQITESKNSP